MKDETKFKDTATALLRTVEKLRAPEGCPWDREQTHHSLRRCLMEEFPQISALIAQVMFAVDAKYAPDSKEIRPEADVACIPPVSGG